MTAAPVEPKQKLAFDFDHATPSSLEPVDDHRALDNGLTRDNLHLSRVTMVAFEAEKTPSEDRVESNQLQAAASRSLAKRFDEVPSNDLPQSVLDLIANSTAASTRRAYRSDIEHFLMWGGTIPASPNTIASYLAAHAGALSIATLVRRVATISKAHEAKGLPSPTTTEIVKATMRGIKRTLGTSQRKSKPLLREDLFLILDRMKDRPKDLRDRALLLVGFAGGFRRSELVGLDRADTETVREGLIVTLRRSKTDQEAAGRKIGIPYGRTRHCPVSALEAWLALSGVTSGPLFRHVDRHGHIHAERLSGEAVSIVIRERLASAGIDPSGFSGHSLRAGFATSAAQAGVSTTKIRAQTGHASDAMLGRYIRDGELFLGNAAGALL
jgi:integrase